MGKIIGFSLLWYLFGNPFVAILILLLILYVLDRRFIGFFPSITRPFRDLQQIRKLRQELRLSPHNTSIKVDLARRLMDRKQYSQALSYLQEAEAVMPDSSEIKAEIAICLFGTGGLAEADAYLQKALELNPRVRYGEPLLLAGEKWADSDQEKALRYMEQFKELHSSSCKAYYRLGQLYRTVNRLHDAKAAFREAIDIYRGLPKYKRKQERRWALMSWFQAI
ncbi:hypothetical protein DUZ99_11190 [Xylanibacillus composti]|uniref:Tetratricopeptide repeat protein n=1 Tax=Xylanibacillus composti TaxID=1572762 RepID=A0A8J4H275_9BACL|nr:tetratricopeptide repeat protein [Xylanibacillus composti]MDT9725535.1 hypothetical protein [Xylanibacillus composti]GIQ67629.1 hypothetical protein XYCOK13_04530 [Xylanibacillus composti]